MTRTRAGLRAMPPLLALLLAPAAAPAQVAYPPKPDRYDAHFRYRIRADQEERIRQFRAMEAFLKQVGFTPAPREDADLDIFDPAAETMAGTVPTAGAARLLDDTRIQTVVLLPSGMALPEDGRKPVQVRINIAAGLSANEQRDLHEQTVRHLGFLGFAEATGYDHAGYSLVRGSLPAGNVLRLLKDLRGQPSGWFAPAVPSAYQPLPFRVVLPVRRVEVLPDLPVEPAAVPPTVPAAPAPAGDPVAPSPGLAKLTPEVRAVLADMTAAGQPLRVDLILEAPPGDDWTGQRFTIRSAAEGASVEGQVGVVVTVRLPRAADVERLAALPEVRSVRLPRAAAETGRVPSQTPPDATTAASLLASTRAGNLHRAGYRGGRVRVVVVASEFTRALGLIGKQLPASTRLIDLTAELNPDLLPANPSADRPANGTAAAALAHAAAPDADLVLIRVDTTAFHQLLTVARAVADPRSNYSEAMQSRSLELVKRAEILAGRRTAATEEYRRAFSDLSDEEKPARRRAEAEAGLNRLIEDERAYRGSAERFAALKAGLDGLHGTAVVVNTLAWDAGFPQDGLSEISRAIDDLFAPKPVRSALRASQRPPVPAWVQAASTSVGQVWAGPFLDADGNGVMEFAPPAAPIPSLRWTRELNFLAFRPATGGEPAALPAGLRLRLTVQWREPHDPDGYLPHEPVFPLTLRLLRQLDPAGKAFASDEFAEVGRSNGPPVRLLKTAGSGAFEQTLDVTLPADGVYALRLEGRPAFDYQLPAFRQRYEIDPRLVVDTADPASAAKGRAVFRTYTTDAAGVGAPGDAAAAVTVGVAGRGPNGEARALTGAGPGVALRTKPDLLLPATITANGARADGTAGGAGFAGGVAASLLSAGVRASDLTRTMEVNPGSPLVIPAELIQSLTRRTGRSERP